MLHRKIWKPGGVALRKESVDRNRIKMDCYLEFVKSLSARRAWIEIILFVNLRVMECVALRKESVDRNPDNTYGAIEGLGRSPQGERG